MNRYLIRWVALQLHGGEASGFLLGSASWAVEAKIWAKIWAPFPPSPAAVAGLSERPTRIRSVTGLQIAQRKRIVPDEGGELVG